MSTRTFTLDAARSKLLVHTRAEGLLARLAHDLQLSSDEVIGTATQDGDTWTASLEVPVRSLAVEGVLRGDVLDRGVLSASDCTQILDKMRADVFGSARTIEVRASGSKRDRGDASVHVGRASMRARLTLSVEEDETGALLSSGSFDVSIKGLGGKAIKAPLGAFSVKDTVRVRFDLALRPAE